jgi:23S rRNA (uracil1939-C5)-methyltransferase
MSSKGSVDVRIRGIAAGGSGIGDLPDGRVVFVPRTAPGDLARVQIDKSKARWAVASLQRLLEPAADRIDAPCLHYAQCGGCQLQHLPYAQQCSAKAAFVQDALVRIGKIEGVEIPEVVPSPSELGYRNRVTFTLRRLPGGYVVAGFHALGRPAHVVDIHRCLLAGDDLSLAWNEIRAGWGDRARNLPDGGRLRLTVRRGTAGVELLVEGGPTGWDAQALAEAAPSLVSVWHGPSGQEAKPTLVSGAAAPGGGTAFEQVNPEAARLLREHVLESAGETTETQLRAIDAYCGGGDFGRSLAEMGWSVVGIESEEAAAQIAASAAPDGFEVVHGKVEEHLEALLASDLLVVNPPRTGLSSDLPQLICATPPARLIYVSCDAATLARDLSGLSPAFELSSLRSFDLFPQTTHVETVAVLTRRGATE